MSAPGRDRGFLVLEILIAGFILTASIAAAMYLFRTGYDYLERANISNTISAKLVQTAGLFRVLELTKNSGTEDMGNGVTLKWEARLLGSSKPPILGGEVPMPSLHELYLYRINFSLDYKNVSRSYEINAFRFKPISSIE
jgi:hypothetical protein